MPNEQQVQRVSNEDLLKFNAFKEENRFYATDLKRDENEAFRNNERYNIEKVSEETAFIERMLNIPTTRELNVSAEQRSSLELNLTRRQSFLLLNDEKDYTSDSKEMARVKKSLETLENTLTIEEFTNLKTLYRISNLYATAIKACKYYVDNKNPWFSTGIRRKNRVQETLKRLIEEKSLFDRGVGLVEEGLIDMDKLKSPYELLESERTKDFEEKAKEERIDKWREDLLSEYPMDDFIEEQKKKNPFMEGRNLDMLPLCRMVYMHDVTRVTDKGTMVSNEIVPDLPLMLKDYGIAGRIADNGVKLGIANKTSGQDTRTYSAGVRFVLRDKNGNPLDEKEELKEEKNKEWEQVCCDVQQAIALAKAKPEDAALQADLQVKRKALLDHIGSRYEELVTTFEWPSVEQVKKDPGYFGRLLLKDPDTFIFMFHCHGMWDGIAELVGKDMVDEFLQKKPITRYMDKALQQITVLLRMITDQTYHLRMAEGIANDLAKDSKARLRNLKNDPNAPARKIQEEEQAIKDDERDLLQQCNDHKEIYTDEDAAIMQKIRAKKLMGQNTDYEEWLLENGIKEKAKKLAMERTKQGAPTTAEQAEMAIVFHEAALSARKENHPDIEEIQKRMAKHLGVQDIGGQMSRQFNSVTYDVKFDAKNEPLNEEEKKKHEWNKKWLNCWTEEGNQEVRKQMMEEGIKRVLSLPVPTPDQIRKKGLWNLMKENPFLYSRFVFAPHGLLNLKDIEPELFNEIIKKDSAMDKKLQMLVELSSLITTELRINNIVHANNFSLETVDKTKRFMQDKEATVSEQIERRRNREEYVKFYNIAENAEAMEKVKEQVLTPEHLDSKLKEAKEKDPSFTREGVLVAETAKLCDKQDEQFKAIEKKGIDLKIWGTGSVSRILTAGIYYIKTDANGNPVNEEEKRKAQHNEFMKNAWSRWLNIKAPASTMDPIETKLEEKRARGLIVNGYVSFIRDMIKVPLPSPEEIKNNPEVLRRFVLEDPFMARTLQAIGQTFDQLNELFGPEMAEALKSVPELDPFVNACSDLMGWLVNIPVNKGLGLNKDSWQQALPPQGMDMEAFKEKRENNFNIYQESMDENIEKYKGNYDKLQQEQKNTIARQLKVKPDEVMTATPYKFVRPDKELRELCNKYVKPLGDEYLKERSEVSSYATKVSPEILKKYGISENNADNVRWSVSITSAMMGLSAVTEEDKPEMFKNLLLIEQGHEMNEEDRKSAIKTVEKILDQALAFDVNKLENITMKELMGPDFKKYRYIASLLAEITEGVINRFYKGQVKDHSTDCKYNLGDLERIRNVVYKATHLGNKLDLANSLYGYYMEHPDSEIDLDLIFSMTQEELVERYDQLSEEYQNTDKKIKAQHELHHICHLVNIIKAGYGGWEK